MSLRNHVSFIAVLALASLLAALPATAERPAGRGACCLDGNCSVGTAEDCEAQGGLYLGDRTNCGQVSCATQVELSETQAALSDCTGNLAATQAELAAAEAALAAAEAELAATQAELAATQADLAAAEAELAATQAELAATQADLAAVEAELAAAEAALAAAEAELAAAEAALAVAEAELMDCETALADAQIFPGDGAGSGPDLSYTDNGDGTVTDNNTGFMWEVKVAGGGGASTCHTEPHAVNSTCNWYHATGAWIDALNAEGGTGYAGYSDWRLPNLKELQSIVDFGEWNPALDPSFPGPLASSDYWSATSYAFFPPHAWRVNLNDGNARNVSKPFSLRVVAVRGGP